MGAGRRLRQGWDRLTIYLPMLLMLLLALGTYWLMRSAPLFATPRAEKEVRRDPDYEMKRFSVKTFDQEGRLKSEIYGDQAWHYPHNDVLEISGVQMRNYNIERGYFTLATATRAITTSQAKEVELIGNAHVLRPAVVDKQGRALPRVSFRGEYLHAFLDEERVFSNQPVELIHGESHIEAQNLNFSNYDQVIELRGRVRGTLLPRGPVSDIQVLPSTASE
ncbi:LPS export ABC transporter periplasmic protein LptC [Hylemonella gracilis]|uniref:LPS export ABC transporter periplasmic protein LptC n=1 Tax=Hylemonella gracilis TaxID=80880 RepID=A0A4P6UQA8_9BURK|nr:LPS export ABC transporter periplasmic protein LptC [Hylemonella gracilis]QBK06355.1 LPS export ABC transporter periplasmic protein LptC [Hylemonella gracilis]